MKKLIFILFLIFIFYTPAFAKNEEKVPKPVVVTFYQKDCEECDALNIVKENIIQEYQGKVDFVKIDFSYEDCDFQKLKTKYNIKKVPTTLFLNPQFGITKKKEGYMSYKEYQSKVKSILAEE